MEHEKLKQLKSYIIDLLDFDYPASDYRHTRIALFEVLEKTEELIKEGNK